MIAGFGDAKIGATLVDPSNPETLEAIHVEEPTLKLTFGVNTSPLAGREGKFQTSRQLRERLFRELETNLSLRVEPIEDRATASFPVPDSRPRACGNLRLQVGADLRRPGAVVRWQANLSVLPATGTSRAEATSLEGAIGAALVGLVVIAGSLVGVRLLRRRPLQER